LFCLLASACFGITLVQSNAGGSATGTSLGQLTTSAVGFTSTTTPGSLLVLIGWASVSGAGCGNPGWISTTTPGFSWTFGGQQTNGASPFCPWSVFLYIANAASMATSVHTTLTVGYSGSGPETVEFSLYEFSGVASSSPLETQNNPTGTGSTPSVGVTITHTDLVLFAYCGQPGSNLSNGAGYNVGVNAAVAVVGQAEYALAVAPGTSTAAFSGGTNARWAGVLAAFKPAISTAARSRGYVF
jgi:hypothetical protein